MKKMICPECSHKWSMSNGVYAFTPFFARGRNILFVCKNCGSEGRKLKKKELRIMNIVKQSV